MELSEAFALLEESLHQIQRDGGQPVAAAVKNRLLRLTDRAFSEPRLGFANFRAFLQAAEAAGIVSLAPTAGGDVEVLLPGQPRSATGPRRMRRDVWNAFIRWDDGKSRLYDRETDRVLYLDPAAAASLTAAGASRYVPIPAPARAATVEAMREFLQRVPEETRAGLEQILQGTGNVEKSFIDALPPDARAMWRSLAAWQVMSRAEAWRQEHGLDLDLHDDPAQGGTPTSPSRTPRSGGGAALQDEAIRRRVIAAVERMPLSAVLQLSIPVEYLLGDGPL